MIAKYDEKVSLMIEAFLKSVSQKMAAGLAAGILGLSLLGGAVIAAQPAGAEEPLHIVIDKGVVEPLPIALPGFIGKNQEEIATGVNIAQVISSDLERSGLFRALDPRSFIERPTDFNTLPRFKEWRIINSEALVTGQAVVQADGQLRVEFRLWDVVRNQQLRGKKYYTTPENWRRIAHLISDEIYARLTGETGYFDTRVVLSKKVAQRLPDANVSQLWTKTAQMRHF